MREVREMRDERREREMERVEIEGGRGKEERRRKRRMRRMRRRRRRRREEVTLQKIGAGNEVFQTCSPKLKVGQTSSTSAGLLFAFEKSWLFGCDARFCYQTGL